MPYKQEIIDKIANFLGINSNLLSDLIKRKENLYRSWRKKKPGGKTRRIEEPLVELKSLQRIVLNKLNEFVFQFPESIQGGVHKKSIRTNALKHRGGKYLLRMDIKDAYPSSTRKRIYALFRKVARKDPAEVAKILTKLTTFRDRLPQGAPTSLIIFNALLRETGVDRVFLNFKDIRYTRYVDDLVFTSKKPIPEELEKEVKTLLKENGFSINRKKTRRYSTKNRSLRITGVNLVGGKPKLPPKMIKKFRGMIGRAIIDSSVSKEQVFGIIAFVVGIEKKIPNQLLRPMLRYLAIKDIVKNCPFTIHR